MEQVDMSVNIATSNMTNHLGSPPPPNPARPYSSVLALPLVHIFSVSLHAQTTSQVYGSIQASELNGMSCYVYDRDPTEPETIFQHGNLSLSGPNNATEVILGTTGVTIDVCLKETNTTGEIELLKGSFYLDPTIEGIENSYDKLMKAVIQSERGSACLYYTTFRFAAYAIVEVKVTEKRDKSSLANVYGSVVACYDNSRQYCTSDDESKYLDTLLFEKSSDQPVRVIVGTPIKLLRSIVVVPAYSSLIIKANISDSQGQLASGDIVFPVEDDAGFYEFIRSDNGCVEVIVKIRSACPRIYKRATFNACTTVVDSDGTMSKKARTGADQLHPLSLEPEGNEPLFVKAPEIKGWLMAEVFSVYIGGINCEVSSLCGTINVDDGSIPFPIYERGWNDSEILPDDKMVCIQGNRPITNAEFRIFLDLKDPNLNLEVSRGMLDWNVGLLDSYGIQWHDKRICSVVQGTHGYAAIHHMIFYWALSAIIEVTFFCDNCAYVTPDVHGVILACYGGHEYSTDYDNKYYKSSLFKRSQKNAEPLKTNSIIPLSKSVVAVHVDFSLVVEANLRVTYNGSSHEEVLFGEVEFTVDMSRTIHKKIQGRSCYIDVSVKFEKPY